MPLTIFFPKFHCDRLGAATTNFDLLCRIGSGGFRSVYLVHLNNNPSSPRLAVKRLHYHHPSSSLAKSFCNEFLILSSLGYPHLLRLHGYCPDPRSLLLVYDYVSSDTLAHHLHSPNPNRLFPFRLRLDIAHDLFIYTALIEAYFKNLRVCSSRQLFDEMPTRGLPLFTAMVSGLARSALSHDSSSYFFMIDSLSYFFLMFKNGILPNNIALVWGGGEVCRGS